MYKTTELVNSNGQRYVSNKIRFTELPPSVWKYLMRYEYSHFSVNALARISHHYMLGQAKYENIQSEMTAHQLPNWAGGMYVSTMFLDSVYRHLMAYLNHELNDKDFNTHHLNAVAWGLCNIIHMFDNYDLYQQYDDRRWVGFNNEGLIALLEYTNDADDCLYLVDVLSYLQTSDSPFNICLAAARGLSICFNVLDDDLPDVNMDFKCDSTAFDEIRNRDYGEVVSLK